VDSGTTKDLFAGAYDEDNSTVLLVGAGGTILRQSGDNPMSFNAEDSGTTADLFAITTFPTSHSNGTFGTVVVGDSGTLLTSRSAWQSFRQPPSPWAREQSGTTVALRGIVFAQYQPLLIWIVGDGGTVLRNNSGWIADTIGTCADLHAIWASDAKHGFVAGSDGTVLQTPGSSTAAPVSCAPPTGYWLTSSDGGVFAHGSAPFKGSEGAHPLNKPIVGMAATPDRQGYWLVASDGGVFTHGDTGFFGSEGAITLNKPIVGMAATPSGHGYWLVASDGGVFTHGDANLYLTLGDRHLNAPIVGLARTPSGHGYWLIASDGGVFTGGDAGFYGSEGGTALTEPVVGMATG
jgi:hypothetical protein